MKKIPLTQGKFANVNDEDYEWLMQWKWYYNKGYAVRREGTKTILMHRLIAETPDGLVTDHIDGDRLNNVRSNLRSCTQRENSRNAISKRGRSRYKGVTLLKKLNRWRATIVHDRKQIQLGFYESEVDAAHAYDNAALELFGEFAKLNFPDESRCGYNPVKYVPKKSSKYAGVTWDNWGNRWRSFIMVDGKKVNLGRFPTEVDAALAFNEAAIKYRGTDAVLNVIDENDSTCA